MDKENWIMFMTVVAVLILLLILKGCSVISVQIVGHDGRVNKTFDPADQSIGIMPPPCDESR